MNILFICTGNTCRSPMASGIMKKIALDNDLDINCTSAGIYAENGAPASEYAIDVTASIGVDISSHTAQPLTPEIIDNADLILTMTESHKMMLSLSTDKAVYTLGEYGGSGADISDPYGGDIEDYEECCDEIYDNMLDVAERVYDEYFADEDK